MTGGLAGFACESNHLPESVAGGKKRDRKGGRRENSSRTLTWSCKDMSAHPERERQISSL